MTRKEIEEGEQMRTSLLPGQSRFGDLLRTGVVLVHAGNLATAYAETMEEVRELVARVQFQPAAHSDEAWAACEALRARLAEYEGEKR